MTSPAAGSLGESTDNTSTHSAAHSIKSPAGDSSQVMTTLSPVQPLPSEDEDKQYVPDAPYRLYKMRFVGLAGLVSRPPRDRASS